MIEKWERQPIRIGMVVGFVVLPTLWILQEIILRLATGYHLPLSDEIRYFITGGALPGAILGAGISQAYFANQKGEFKQARRDLLLHSVLVLSAVMLQVTFSNGGGFLQIGTNRLSIPPWLDFWINPAIYKNFAFQSALLMFFIGLLMRPRR